MTIKQVSENRARSKASMANQSHGSKKRKHSSKNIIDSHSKESRQSRRSGRGISNSPNADKMDDSSNQKKQINQSKNKHAMLMNDTKSGKKSSIGVGLLPLDIMAGPTIDEFEDRRLSTE